MWERLLAMRGITALTAIIAIAWMGTCVIEVFAPSFEAPRSLDPLMLLVGGYYFTNTAVEKKKKEKADEEDE